MPFALALSVVLAARPLTSAELASVQARLGDRRPIAGQAFETARSSDAALWFVPADRDGNFLGLLLDQDRHVVARLELDSAAGERLVSFDSVSFVDADDNGFADAIAVAHTRAGGGRPKPRALLLMQREDGFAQDYALEREVAQALGERLTMARLRERLRPRLLAGVTVACRQVALPLAASAQGAWAFNPGADPAGIFSLATSEPPPWLTPRLAKAVARIEGPDCAWRAQEGMIHGGSPACNDPVGHLNDVLSGLPEAPTFSDFVPALDTSVASVRGSTLRLKKAVAGLGPGRVALPGDCPTGVEARGALWSARALIVVLAPAEADLPTTPFADPPEAEECFRSGGTCVHDIVPIVAPRPAVWLAVIQQQR